MISSASDVPGLAILAPALLRIRKPCWFRRAASEANALRGVLLLQAQQWYTVFLLLNLLQPHPQPTSSPPIQVAFFESPSPTAGTVVRGFDPKPRSPEKPPATTVSTSSLFASSKAKRTKVERIAAEPVFSSDGQSQNGGDTEQPVPAGTKLGAGGEADGIYFDSQRLLYPDPHLPEEYKRAHANQSISSLYLICVRTDGTISQVLPLESVAEIDAVVVQTVKSRWLYRRQPRPVCMRRRFIFLIQ